MKWQFEDKATRGRFVVSMGDNWLKGAGILQGREEMVNTIVCNQGPAKTVVIDRISYTMPAMSVLPLVANQHFVFEHQDQLLSWQFNRDFYCIADHDAEVGCVGFLFYGIEHPLFISLSEEELNSLSMIGRLCVEEMSVTDMMQGEMLRTHLKRLIINVTGIAKRQTESYRQFTDDRMNVIRRFNLLLEAHFRVQHEVQFYAGKMNRSPKTLTNCFALCRYPAPSKLIQRRIILEAKRFLYYTDKSAKEVADELGFASSAHFSRFFKANAGVNFSALKS
jgi:AraC family transcriptional regulator, transcriptional activator of pobA